MQNTVVLTLTLRLGMMPVQETRDKSQSEQGMRHTHLRTGCCPTPAREGGEQGGQGSRPRPGHHGLRVGEGHVEG